MEGVIAWQKLGTMYVKLQDTEGGTEVVRTELCTDGTAGDHTESLW